MSKNKIIGSFIGLAVGDALGAPYEFKTPPYKISHDYVKGGVHDISIGEWTDDTSMALCLAQSLIDKNGFDAKDQMNKYLSWEQDGYFSTRSRNFDIGNTVARALSMYRRTKEPLSGITGDDNSGNGSLMRLAPISLFYYQNKESLIKYASLSSQTTHKSELAIDACICYAQLISGAIQGYTKEDILSIGFIHTVGMRKDVINVIEGSYKEERIYKPTGYVIDTLETALMAFYKFNSFEDGLLHVISLGYDTDTVGAVYGQLAGAFYGYDNIPTRWKSSLMKHDMIYNIAIDLFNCTLEPKKIKDDEIDNNIHVLVGDITTINAEAVVNAANYSLLGGGGVDGAIHRAAGAKLLEECKFLRETSYPNGLPVGEAVITNGGNLKASYVVHTVGPQYRFDYNPKQFLESCYRSSFLLADTHKCKSIAFPSIATGVYAYPKNEASKIAYDIINNLLPNATHIKDVIFVFFSQEDANIFNEVNSFPQ